LVQQTYWTMNESVRLLVRLYKREQDRAENVCYDGYVVLDKKYLKLLIEDYKLTDNNTLPKQLEKVYDNETFLIRFDWNFDKTTVRFKVDSKRDLIEQYQQEYMKYWEQDLRKFSGFLGTRL